MTLYFLADGDDFTASDFRVVMEQGVTVHATRAARTAALAASYISPDVPPDGMTTWLVDEQVEEQYISSAWVVVRAKRQRVTKTSAYTPPSSTDASVSTTAFSLTLKAGKTYRVRGELWTPTGTMKLTSGASTGTITGIWGAGSAGAALFDVTSASSVFAIPQGRNSVSGEITASVDLTWQVRGYNQTSSATLDIGSWIEVERTA